MAGRGDPDHQLGVHQLVLLPLHQLLFFLHQPLLFPGLSPVAPGSTGVTRCYLPQLIAAAVVAVLEEGVMGSILQQLEVAHAHLQRTMAVGVHWVKAVGVHFY